MGADRAVAVLVRTHLRRIAPEMRRRCSMLVVAGLAIGLLAGWRNGFIALLIGGVGASYLLQVPLDLARDRISGELRVLTTLPVGARTVIAAKFGTAAILCLVGALHWPMAVLAAPRGWWDGMPAIGLTAFVTGWMVLTVTSFVAIAVLLRYELQTVLNGHFPVAVVGAVLLSGLFERWRPASIEQVRWVLSRPWFEPAATTAGLLVAVLVSALAFHVASRGLERYRPRPDAVPPWTPFRRPSG